MYMCVISLQKNRIIIIFDKHLTLKVPHIILSINSFLIYIRETQRPCLRIIFDVYSSLLQVKLFSDKLP